MHGFRDFKNFEQASLGLWKPLTVLIGRNGSGKTNAIEGVELLATLAHGRSLPDVADLGRGGGSFEVRGGLAGCARHGKDAFELTFAAQQTHPDGQVHPYSYRIKIAVGPEPRITEEDFVLTNRKVPLFRARLGANGLLRVVYDNFARGGNKPSFSAPSDRSVLSQYAHAVRVSDELKRAHMVVASCQAFLRSSFVFDPEPHAMRGYARIGEAQLRRNGSNLSAVLHALQSGSEIDRATLDRIRVWISQVPEEEFRAIEFVTTKLNDVVVAMRRSRADALTDARVLSDGTLRALAVLTALETAAHRSRVVIEEFDNGVHPSRVKVLVDAVVDVAKRRHLNVVVTTQNPATLDALPAGHHDGVVLCVADPKTHSSKLVPLLSVPQADVLLEAHHLGDLVSRSLLERHATYDGPDVRHQAMRKWVAGLAR